MMRMMIIMSFVSFMILTVSMFIMVGSSVFVMFIMDAMITIVFFVFFFTELIRLIPSCLNEYFQSRVQMDNKNEEHKTQNSKYDK